MFASSIMIFAEELPSIIGAVILTIDGKTNEDILRNDLDLIPYEETYISTSELMDKIEERKQYLFNKRIFESVEVSIELIDTTNSIKIYKVTFNIIDAETFLPLPFAKYDSNYGVKLGLKLFDTNLFGLLADFKLDTNIRQLSTASFSNFEILSIMNLNDMQIFDQCFDLEFSLEGNIIDGVFEDGEFFGEVYLRGIKIKNTLLDIYINIELAQAYDGNITAWTEPKINSGFKWSNIELFSTTVNLGFNVEGTSSSTDVFEILTYATKVSLPNLSLFDKDFLIEVEDIISISTESNILLSHKMNTGISFNLTLPLDIKYKITGEVLSAHTEKPFESLDFSTKNEFTHGRVNWNDNFREGESISFIFSTLMPIDKDLADLVDNFSTHSVLNLTYFKLFKDFFNLGIRTIGYYATQTQKKFPVIPGEYIRGILDANLPKLSGYGGLTINTNLIFKAFDFTLYIFDRSPDGEFFISPFFDFSFFNSTPLTDPEGPDWVTYSGGLELYVIFDNYRSYPIRATFGVNLEDVLAFSSGDIDFNQIEMEIILGLGLFY
jgi:hypothetical protein